jgi:hypothetical protein
MGILRAIFGRSSRRDGRVGYATPPTHVFPGMRCRCGRGTIVPRIGKYGPFLGCTAWRRDGLGCNNVWRTTGSRLPWRRRGGKS